MKKQILSYEEWKEMYGEEILKLNYEEFLKDEKNEPLKTYKLSEGL